jgi:hypothetical protein
VAEADEEFGADRDFTRLAALGVVDAQAALIDEGEVGAVAAVAKGAQELGDLVTGEDVG